MNNKTLENSPRLSINKVAIPICIILTYIFLYSESQINSCKPVYDSKKITQKKEKNTKEFLYVNYDGLGVRKNMNNSSPIILRLYKGMQLEVLERKTCDDFTWVKIIINKKEYWVKQNSQNQGYLSQEYDMLDSLEKYRSKYKMIIDKSDRELNLYKKDDEEWSQIKKYKISISASGSLEPKKKEGDGLTPTGEYYIANVNPCSSFGKNPNNGGCLESMHISYPNHIDAWKGLNRGDLTFAEYESIVSHTMQRKVTPQNLLGSYIMIHGGGDEYDWTAGCIALDNNNMYRLSQTVEVGTPVYIYE